MARGQEVAQGTRRGQEKPRASSQAKGGKASASPVTGLGALDHRVSRAVWGAYNAVLPQWPLHVLEMSGHGVLWLISVPMLYWADFRAGRPASQHRLFLLTLYLGLLTDLAYVCVCKLVVRRARPHWNRDTQVATVQAVDKFSFPSGHTTRCVFVATLVATRGALPGDHPWVVAVVGWAIAVALSRVCLGRHYAGDVLCGVVVGVLNALTVEWAVDVPRASHEVEARCAALWESFLARWAS